MLAARLPAGCDWVRFLADLRTLGEMLCRGYGEYWIESLHFGCILRGSGTETIASAASFFGAGPSRLPAERATPLILEAAQEHFNSASSRYDDGILLARSCLALVESKSEDFVAEMHLIDGLEMLEREYGVRASH